jgi:hypothetical protein
VLNLLSFVVPVLDALVLDLCEMSAQFGVLGR